MRLQRFELSLVHSKGNTALGWLVEVRQGESFFSIGHGEDPPQLRRCVNVRQAGVGKQFRELIQDVLVDDLPAQGDLSESARPQFVPRTKQDKLSPERGSSGSMCDPVLAQTSRHIRGSQRLGNGQPGPISQCLEEHLKSRVQERGIREQPTGVAIVDRHADRCGQRVPRMVHGLGLSGGPGGQQRHPRLRIRQLRRTGRGGGPQRQFRVHDVVPAQAFGEFVEFFRAAFTGQKGMGRQPIQCGCRHDEVDRLTDRQPHATSGRRRPRIVDGLRPCGKFSIRRRLPHRGRSRFDRAMISLLSR